MKRFVAAVAVAAVVSAAGAASVFAQNRGRVESDLAVINVSLERIWPYRLGYVVQYRLPGNRMARAYLPIEWFGGGDDRAELIALPAGASWPSLSVFFRDGEFVRLRLYVHRSPMHQTWGNIPSTVNLQSSFEGIETLELRLR